MSNQTQLQAIGDFTVADMETMRLTLAKDANNEQFALFVRTAAASGLNPFLNHIYCIVYGGKMSIQISVEGIVFLAKRVEGYQGIDTQLVHENDVFKAKKGKDEQGRDVWEIIDHEIVFPRGKVIGCYSIAYRENFRPVTEFMEVDEVQHHLSGTNAGNWKKYFNDFFKKTVTKRSAKRQFGIEVSEDEAQTGGADVPEYKPGERKDITQEAEALNSNPPTNTKGTGKGTTKPPEDEGPKPLDEEQPDPDAEKIVAIRAEVAGAFEKLGIMGKEERAMYLKDNAKVKGEKPTLTEYKALLKIMKMQIEDKEFAEAERAAAGDDEPAFPLE